MKKLVYHVLFSLRDLSIGPSRHTRFNLMIGPVLGGGGLGPVGIEGGPNWRGDHTFSHSSLMYSLEHFLEPKIADQHPGWTKQQIRTEARREMAISLWESHSFYTKERKRQPEISKRWETVETSLGVFELSTTWGNQRYTLHELWAHTKEYAEKTGNPAAYNVQEAEAQFELEAKLLSGEVTSGATILSDVDSYRYAQIWRKTTDGYFHTEVIDLGLVAGRDLSIQDSSEILQHMEKLYEGKHKNTIRTLTSHPMILVKEGTIQAEDIKTITQWKTIAQTAPTEIRVATDVANTAVEVAQKTVNYAGAVVSDLGESVASRLQNSIRQWKENIRAYQTDKKAEPVFLQLLRGNADIKSDTIERKRQVKKDVVLFHNDRSEKRTRKAVHLVEMHNATLLAAESGVGGALVLLRQSMKQEKRTQRRNKNRRRGLIPKKENRLDRRVHLEGKEKKKKREMKRHEQRVQKLLPTKENKRKRLRRQRRQEVVRKKALNKERKMITKKKDILHRERGLLHLLAMMAKHINKPERRRVQNKKWKETPAQLHIEQRKSIKENKLVTRFAFAWVLWLLLKTNHEPKQRIDISIDRSKTGKTKELHFHQQSRWLLLAIIWHLAMIREQRAPVSNKKRRKTTHTNVFYTNFPPQGVIFTFVT